MDYFYPPEMIVEVHDSIISASGGYWVRCPYDSSHKALDTRFRKHVERCRANYLTKKLRAREPINTATCRYNPRHVVYPPELHLHEHSCPNKAEMLFAFEIRDAIVEDAMKLVLEKLDRSGVQQLAASQNIEIPKSIDEIATEIDKDDLNRLETWIKEHGFDPDNIISSVHKILAEQLDVRNTVLWANPKDAYERGATNMSVIPQHNNFDPVLMKIEKKKREPTHITEPNDDAEVNWNEIDENAKGFNWLAKREATPPTSFKVPQGLNKSLRKQFVEKAQEVLKYEYGLFRNPEDDEEIVFPKSFEVDVSTEFLCYGIPQKEPESQPEARNSTKLNI